MNLTYPTVEIGPAKSLVSAFYNRPLLLQQQYGHGYQLNEETGRIK